MFIKNLTSRSQSQWLLIRLAISFFTRLPISFQCEVTAEMLHRASRYFALVGALIGLLCAVIFVLATLVFPVSIAVLLTMAVNLLLTGAFHEDGWADVWDGFGGGWQVSDKLNIMKDSRLGTYGAAALFILLLLKYQSLTVMAGTNANSTALTTAVLSTAVLTTAMVIIISQTLSRVLATSLIVSMSYVREDANSKVKPLAQHLSPLGLAVLLTTGALVLLGAILFGNLTTINAGVLILTLVALRQIIMLWFNKQLGGYTGDCLGAAQQLTEVVIYLFFLVAMP